MEMDMVDLLEDMFMVFMDMGMDMVMDMDTVHPLANITHRTTTVITTVMPISTHRNKSQVTELEDTVEMLSRDPTGRNQ